MLRTNTKRKKLKRRAIIHCYQGMSHERFTRRARYIVLRALEERLPLERAAELAGMTGKMLQLWIKRGAGEDESIPHFALYRSFRRRVYRIRAQHESEALRRIEAAGKGGRKVTETKIRVKSLGPIQEREIIRVVRHESPKWQADAWYLEKTNRKEYGRDAPPSLDDSTPEEDAAAIKAAADVLFDSVPLEAGGDQL